jgi:hypothetical protein
VTAGFSAAPIIAPCSLERADQMSVNLYITGNKSDTAVLYLTDIYGINLTENRLYVGFRENAIAPEWENEESTSNFRAP